MQANKQVRIDFQGEELFIGLDVHKKNWSVVIYTKHLEVKRFTQPSSPKLLVDYLHRHFPGASYHTAYEAGFSGFWIHKELIKHGIKNIIINPADVPTTDKEKKQKRDESDSRKIGQSLRAGRLKGIYIPTQEQLCHRHIMRTRNRLVRDMSRYKNRIKSLLNFHGIAMPESLEKGNWTKSSLRWLSDQCKVASPWACSLELMLDQLHHLISIKQRTDKKILDLANTIYEKQVKLIRCIPGMGILGAMIIITEIGNIKRFKRLDELCSYVGLIPNVYASGEKQYTGGLTKRSNKYIQPVLIECAWKAMKKDPQLLLSYNELLKRMKGSKAIIRIARKLLSRIRHVLITEKEYITIHLL